MNLFNKQIQLPIVSTNPESFRDYKQQQYNQESTIAENRNYILLTTCLFEAIVREYSDKLLPIDIIYFFQILTLYSSALSKNEEEIIYSSEKLAKILGYTNKEASNMRSTILGITKKLEQAELLKVHRSKNKNGIDKVNKIVPILPDLLYEKIKYESSNSNVESKRLTNESNLQHIMRTKLFVPITLTFIQNLFKDSMTPKHKLFCLNCIITAYKNYQITGQFSFAATSKELMKANNISRGTLTTILAYIRKQASDFFIKAKHTYTKSDDPDCNRYDKSIFVISINPLVIPYSFIKNTDNKVALEFSDTKCLDVENETIKPYTYEVSQAACQKTMPSMPKNNAYNNKDIIIKESNKNIDANIDKNLDEKNEALDKLSKNNQLKPQTFIQTLNTQHLESEPCSLLSKSLKNSVKDFIDALPPPSNATFTDASKTIKENLSGRNKKKSSHTNIINDRKHKDFRYFYPISEKEASMLNFKANREFDTNFTNQLLLKLSTKYPEKRFKNKFTFSDYMIKALKQEYHQGPFVNNLSFRFSCNIEEQEKRVLECEQYLSNVESSSDTCKISQIKKKIAGRFSSEISHSILTTARFIEGSSGEILTILLPENLMLSDMQREILTSEVCSVYGNNKCYLDSVKTGFKISAAAVAKEEGNMEEAQSASTFKPQLDKPRSTPLSSLSENSVWRQVRQALVLQYGNDIDTAWFSKAVAVECQQTSLLLLTMPHKFMADWLKNHYGYAISRISGTFGFKYIEYHH